MDTNFHTLHVVIHVGLALVAYRTI